MEVAVEEVRPALLSQVVEKGTWELVRQSQGARRNSGHGQTDSQGDQKNGCNLRELAFSVHLGLGSGLECFAQGVLNRSRQGLASLEKRDQCRL